MERIKEFFSNINWTNSLCKKLGLGLAAMLLFVVAMTTHSGKTTADTSDDSSSSAPDSSQVETDLKYDTSYIKLDNETMTNSGLLALDNKDHKYAADGSDFVFIYQYLFNDKGEQVMSTSSTGVCGTQEMMEHLNKMVSDFAAQTGLKTIMVTNASYQVDGKLYMTQYDVPETTEAAKETPEENAEQNGDENGEATEQKQEKKPQTNAGSTTADGCYEHLSGMAIDFQLYEADKGTYPEFTGEGQYAWINENCWKYGFVLRYPADKQEVTGVAEKKNHYRYVGAVYAQIMHENNLALEELYAFLDKYTYEKPLRVNGADGNVYIAYSQELDKDNTSTTVGTPDTARKDVASDLTFTGTGDEKVYISAYISGGAAQAQTAQPESSKTE